MLTSKMLCGSFFLLFLASSGNAAVDKANIAAGITLALSYLEKVGNLDFNATFNVVTAEGELIYLENTAKTITDDEKNKITDWKNRMEVFIDSMKKSQPNKCEVANLFYPEDWVNDGDYRFKARLISGTPTERSEAKIYGYSLLDDKKCNAELCANKKVDKARSCGISQDCMDKMTNTNGEAAVAPIHRALYLSVLRYMKCTENPSNSFSIITAQCNWIYKCVLSLTAYGYKQKLAYFYMDKVLLCGTYGFPEFYADNILQTLMIQQNPDGSIGTESDEVKKVLTAQYVAILSSAYRLKVAGIV